MEDFSDFVWFLAAEEWSVKKMDGNKPILAAKNNCHKLLCVSWVLTQISFKQHFGLLLVPLLNLNVFVVDIG